MNSPAQDYTFSIIGGGLVGASFALALQPLAQQLGCKVALIEKYPPQNFDLSDKQPSFDGRSTALSWNSHLLFERLGLWSAISQQATPIKHIETSDKGYLGKVYMHASEQQTDALGYIVPNSWLGQCLWQALKDASQVDILAPASIDQVKFTHQQVQLSGVQAGQPLELTSQLLTLADGGSSNLKQQLGIADDVYDYQQTAIFSKLELSQPHNNWAYERFTGAGAMALLPMNTNEMALVWTLSPEEAEQKKNTSKQALLFELQTIFGSQAGQFIDLGEIFTYPLRKVLAKEQVRSNLALLGNTAHYLHPVAGQGFNLALKGVVSLAAALEEENRQATAKSGTFNAGKLATLEAWQARQQPIQNQVIGFSHNLIQLFGQNSPLVGHLRGAGLISLNAISPLKRWLTNKAMGL